MSTRIGQQSEQPVTEQGTEVWRSIGELEKTPQFRTWLEREFPEGSSELTDEEREMSRRNFVKLMGASSALAGLTLASCRRPESYIVPYREGPEWVIPGKSLYYATSMPRSGGAVPLVVTTHEGRPTKLEPNRRHADGGGTDAFTQASVLDLYSPSRSRTILKNGKPAKAADFVAAMGEVATGSGTLGFVFGEDDSPTRNRLVKELAAKYAGARFYSYEALTGEGRKTACAEGFGSEGAATVADFTKAKRILSLDCDLASLDPQGKVKDFFAGRQGGGGDYEHEIDPEKMNRLYVVETAYSMTGGMADHRMRATPGEIFRIAAEIARRVQVETKNAALSKILADIPLLSFGTDDAGRARAAWVYECAADLAAHKGEALVLAGSRHHEGLHRLALAMNAALKSLGADKPLEPVQTGKQGYGTIDTLAADLESGAIETLILLTPANPVYDSPADLDFPGLMAKAKTTVHFGLTTNASAWAATWHVPAAHYLESWSDARTINGVYSIVQPMILPLYGGVSELEFLAQLMTWKDVDWAAVKEGKSEAPALLVGEGSEGDASPAYYEVRTSFEEIGGEGDAAWKAALKAGFLADSTYDALEPELKLDPAATKAAVEAATVTTPAGREALEVSFATDGSVWDGRYIDNGWLQEAPDPISKLAWDNAAQMSPATAKELGIYERIVQLESWRAAKPEIDEGRDAKAPMVTVVIGGRELEVPVIVAFGHADNCITISLGYGQGATDERQGAAVLDREKPVVGLVGRNTGFNAYPLRTQANPLFATGATTKENAAKDYKVAFTQEHHAMYGRALAREISTQPVEGTGKGDFQAQLEGVRTQGIDAHAPDNISLYKPKGSSIWQKDEDKVENLLSDKIHQWGMTIDLNTCMGCNACLVACQAENNIPIVGKEQVAMGREMHWIRMDRYFAAPKFDREHGHVATGKDESGKTVNKLAPAWVRDNPEMIPQPVACVQCESAPCETVCPVNATVHTEEGLNTMAYNRCIGTRYCANNCPYKARRFNYFDYNKRNPLIDHNLYKGPFGEKQVGTAPHLQRNPNVTVRMRGVMEKCTYCVQRLEGAKIKQKQVQRAKTLEGGKGSVATKITAGDLRVTADSVKTACQDSCPADAIRFGNLLHGDQSAMVRAKGSKRNYDLLNYVGTLPRTSYLARVKNPNPDMPDAKFAGQATIHMT